MTLQERRELERDVALIAGVLPRLGAVVIQLQSLRVAGPRIESDLALECFQLAPAAYRNGGELILVPRLGPAGLEVDEYCGSVHFVTSTWISPRASSRA